MLKISNSVELIKKVISGQTSKTSSFNRYDPLPTNRPAHRYNAIDPKVARTRVENYSESLFVVCVLLLVCAAHLHKCWESPTCPGEPTRISPTNWELLMSSRWIFQFALCLCWCLFLRSVCER